MQSILFMQQELPFIEDNGVRFYHLTKARQIIGLKPERNSRQKYDRYCISGYSKTWCSARGIALMAAFNVTIFDHVLNALDIEQPSLQPEEFEWPYKTIKLHNAIHSKISSVVYEIFFMLRDELRVYVGVTNNILARMSKHIRIDGSPRECSSGFIRLCNLPVEHVSILSIRIRDGNRDVEQVVKKEHGLRLVDSLSTY